MTSEEKEEIRKLVSGSGRLGGALRHFTEVIEADTTQESRRPLSQVLNKLAKANDESKLALLHLVGGRVGRSEAVQNQLRSVNAQGEVQTAPRSEFVNRFKANLDNTLQLVNESLTLIQQLKAGIVNPSLVSAETGLNATKSALEGVNRNFEYNEVVNDGLQDEGYEFFGHYGQDVIYDMAKAYEVHETPLTTYENLSKAIQQATLFQSTGMGACLRLALGEIVVGDARFLLKEGGHRLHNSNVGVNLMWPDAVTRPNLRQTLISGSIDCTDAWDHMDTWAWNIIELTTGG